MPRAGRPASLTRHQQRYGLTPQLQPQVNQLGPLNLTLTQLRSTSETERLSSLGLCLTVLQEIANPLQKHSQTIGLGLPAPQLVRVALSDEGVLANLLAIATG
jgi:hypothetical protein